MSATRAATAPCPVTMRLADGSLVDGVLHLLADPSRSTGYTPVESLLDGPRDFFVLGLPTGGSMLVSRNAIRTVTLSEKGPGASDVPDSGSLDVVTLHLDSGEDVSGVLRAVAPQGFERMSDVINACGRFIVLGTGDSLVLVTKSRVVRISF